MAGVNTVAILGEQKGDVAHLQSGSGSLTIRFNEHSSAASRRAGAAKDAGPGLIAASSRISLRRAVQIAAVALRDQEDPSGQPRILQAISVMNACSTEDERIVAVLHSAVESGRCSLEALRCEGLPENLITAVDALTRRPGDLMQLRTALQQLVQSCAGDGQPDCLILDALAGDCTVRNRA